MFAAIPQEPSYPAAEALTRLTTLSGPELAEVVKATGEYERRLCEELRASPVALSL